MVILNTQLMNKYHKCTKYSGQEGPWVVVDQPLRNVC